MEVVASYEPFLHTSMYQRRYKRKFGFDIRYFYKLIKADVRVTERKLMVKNSVRFKF